MSEGKEPSSISGPWMDKERVWKTFFEPNLSEYTSSHETGREKGMEYTLLTYVHVDKLCITISQ